MKKGLQRYYVKRLGKQSGDGLHGRDGIKWAVMDRSLKAATDSDPCDSKGEAEALAHALNCSDREAKKEAARLASIPLIAPRAQEIAEAAHAAGWSATIGNGSKMFGEDWAEADTPNRFVECVHPDGHAVVVFNLSPVESYRSPWCGVNVDGDVLVDGGSFIRRGIDVSCCSLSDAPEGHAHDYATVAELLEGEKARVDACLARKTTAVAIPTLPFTRQPDWIAKAKVDLANGRSVTLMPHGFGTGYILTTRRGRDVAVTPASPELKAFFGFDDLRIATTDCD